MAVDVLNEVARRLDMRLQWVPTGGSLDEALETEKVDLWPVVSIRDERKHRLHLTEPWLENRFCLLSLAERNIWSPKDTAGKRVRHPPLPADCRVGGALPAFGDSVSLRRPSQRDHRHLRSQGRSWVCRSTLCRHGTQQAAHGLRNR